MRITQTSGIAGAPSAAVPFVINGDSEISVNTIERVNVSSLRCLPDSYSYVFSANGFDGVALGNYIKRIADRLHFPFISILEHPSISYKLQGGYIEPANDRIKVMLKLKYFIGIKRCCR